ncbi:unnamed protein product [Cochlearia groenlandica]
MLNLNELPSIFDNELNAKTDAAAESEERATDLEAGSPPSQTNSPPLPANSPPLPEVIPPPPANSPERQSSTPRAKRARESIEGGSESLPEEKMRIMWGEFRTNMLSSRSRGLKKKWSLGPDLRGRIHLLLQRPATSNSLRLSLGLLIEDLSSSGIPFIGGDGFGYRLREESENGFDFFYDGLVPFLNHKEASVGFQQVVYSIFHGDEPPNGLLFSEEIAQLARLEQRVAYKRTLLNFSYKKLLISAAGEKDSARNRLDVVEKDKALVEKERDVALAKVKNLEKDLGKAKKEKMAKRLKEQLEKVERENMDIKKKLEIEAESSNARDLALESSREAEAAMSVELTAMKEHYDDLHAHSVHEIARLCSSRFEHVQAAKGRFAELHEASEPRLGKLNEYLAEQEFSKDTFLRFNQLQGVFGTLERLDSKFGYNAPKTFETALRIKEGKLERWLGERPKLSYAASDFEIPSDLGIDTDPEVSEPEDEIDEDAEAGGGNDENVEQTEEGDATRRLEEGEERQDEHE